MKISNLISALSSLQATHGDLDIAIPNLTGFDLADEVEVVRVRRTDMADAFGPFALLKGGEVDEFPAVGALTPDETGLPVVVIGRTR